jgi:secondary thiamine-phosphate synthase enzyme
MIVTKTIELKTKGGTDIINITPEVEKALASSKLKSGMVTVFVTHTTCGVTINEYEPGLVSDIKNIFEELVPEKAPYLHNQTWGDANGYAHLRASLLGFSVTIPIIDGKMMLGTWQQVILLDFDNRPRERTVILQFTGE